MLIAMGKALKGQKGQSLVEYGLILAVMVIGVILVMQAIGTKVKSKVDQVNANVQALT